MKRWLGGVLTGIVLTFVLLFALAALGWYLRQRPPELEANTTLVLDISGDVPEQKPTDIPGQLFGQEQTTFVSLLEDIEKAGADSRIQAILLKPVNLEVGWAKLEQVRESLEQFEHHGKHVYAFLGVAGSKEYFLASVANKIYLSPVGDLDLKGMRAEVMLFKDALAKIGVQADLEHIGRYKNFSDQFTDDKMSDSFREATQSLLDSIYGQFINTIAAARQRPPEQMRSLIEEQGPFDAEHAQSAGLVDKLLYEDEIPELAPKGTEKPPKVQVDDYSRVPAESVGLRAGPRIALVYAVGEITGGEDGFDPVFAGKTLGSQSMSTVLESVEQDDSIKGVVLRIDSPGGDAFASDDIWRDMVRLRKKKPVVISMSDTAASGGYYIAMTGDPIVAEPGTVTGSIGIVYGKLNLKGLYDKLGYRKEFVSRGKFSGMDSDYGPYTPEERERVRGMMEDFYKKFIDKVGAARKMTPQAVDQIAQGRVWTGEQAKQNGLIDDLGGLQRAVDILKQKAGISPDSRVQLIEYPKRKSLLDLLLSRAQMDDFHFSPLGLSEWLAVAKHGAALTRRPLWARMPFGLDFE